jgi:hypothetical protein
MPARMEDKGRAAASARSAGASAAHPREARVKKTRLIKCLCRDLGLDADEETRRVFYQGVTGKRSLTDMSDAQLSKVIDQLKRQPGLAGGGRAYKGVEMDQSPQGRKIRSLWLELRDLGVLRDSGEDALKKYVLRRFGTWKFEDLNPGDIIRLIEQLKSWVDRARKAGPVADKARAAPSTEAMV